MLRHRPSLILFDLDGTLVDSAPDLAAAIDRMLVSLGRPPAGEDQVRGWIGHGMPQLVRRALTGALWPSEDPPQFEEALKRYMDFYAEALADRSRLYPGVLEALEWLKALGMPMACVTNKHSAFSAKVLEGFGLLGFFSAVVSGDDFKRPKPDPMPLLHLAETFKVSPSEVLMIGDSESDAKAARAAGMMLALVTYGYPGAMGIDAFSPDLRLDSLASLKDAAWPQ